MQDKILVRGHIIGKIRYLNGSVEHFDFPNTVLNCAKVRMADFLINESPKPIHITHVLFGDGAFEAGEKKEPSPTRTSLFGIVRANKKVVRQVDPEIPTQLIFSITLENEDANGHVLNEMALQMNDGELFSISTFPNLTKTDDFAVDWLWIVNFV